MNYTIASNFSTNLTCILVDNVNFCQGNIAVVPYNQDIIVSLLIILVVLIFIQTIRSLL